MTIVAQDRAADQHENTQSILGEYAQVVNGFRCGVNPYFTGKLPKDAPDAVWYGFNAAFEHRTLTLPELANHIGQGHAVTALCRGTRKVENFIAAQHLGVDFDTEDSRSSLDNLLSHPFIASHAAILHTTSSHKPEKPRARVIFVLDQQVADPAVYARYAVALNSVFGCTDSQCHDAARLWFGAVGCEVRTLGGVLPVAVLDDLVAQWEAEQPPVQEHTPFVAVDVSTLLDEAVKRGLPGSRNATGFWLACRLRDAGYDLESARDVMQTYQMTVERTGGHSYTLVEAIASLSSAYKRKPRTDATIDQVEADVMAGLIVVSANVQKTLWGLCAIARRKNSAEGFTASLREIERESGIGKDAVRNHLSDLLDSGVISRESKSDWTRGTLYTLHTEADVTPTYAQCLTALVNAWGVYTVTATAAATMAAIRAKHRHSSSGGGIPACECLPFARMNALSDPADGFSDATQHAMSDATVYAELQAQPACIPSARVVGELAACDLEAKISLGSSAQRILATLAAHPEGVDGLDTLGELTHLSRNTVKNKIALLEHHGLVTVTGGSKVGKTVTLVSRWQERLNELAPALTTFGWDILRGMRAAGQRKSHHAHMLKGTKDAERRVISEKAIARAELEEKHYESQLKGAYAERED